jgi:hypothetical protein
MKPAAPPFVVSKGGHHERKTNLLIPAVWVPSLRKREGWGSQFGDGSTETKLGQPPQVSIELWRIVCAARWPQRELGPFEIADVVRYAFFAVVDA